MTRVRIAELGVRAVREVSEMTPDQAKRAERAADYLARRGGPLDAAYGVEIAKAIRARSGERQIP